MIDGSHGRRVGELAQASGLTVRTLHYYEEIGLVVPSARTAAGHRLYADADVARLYRVLLLRRLGLSLAEVAQALAGRDYELPRALTAHAAEVDRTLAGLGRLRVRLAQVLASIQASGEASSSEVLGIVEEMSTVESTVQRRISVLVYADLAAAYEYLTRVFDLGPGEVNHDGDGTPVHAELQAGDGVLWLHPESAQFGLASPRSLGSATSTVAILVDDVDAHHRHAVAEGASIVYPPVDQPYGYREYSARDPEGHLWSFMQPLG